MGIKKKSGWIILVILIVGIKIFSFFPVAVENYYSAGFYPFISRFLRILFGWIPFSIGDIFYGVVVIYFFYIIVSFLKKLFTRQLTKKYFFTVIRQIIFTGLFVYVLFNLLWGLNYNRKGIAYQLQLNVQPYSTTELTAALQVIVDKLNSLDSTARQNRDFLKKKKNLFSGSVHSYEKLSGQSNIFTYSSPSVKPSVFSYLGNYLGFTGYYNPFSGEAQINTTVPLFIQPFTVCHEIGHQLGYAKENEANIAGYLSAKSSGDPVFQYSVYFDLYIYAARELYIRDSTLLKPFREQLNAGVRKDYRELQQFYRRYKNPLEPMIWRLYGRHLRANEQPQGIMSYNEVIAWLVAYYKKYGKEAI